MRIIAGKFGGRRLAPPARIPARPTTDRAREALFNILANRYEFSALRVLDLFSGTGSICLEFVSRGCPEVVAVERDYASVAFIKKVQKEWDIEGLGVIRADVFRFLQGAEGNYDIIFADPPYDMPRQDEIVSLAFGKNLLREGACLILEHAGMVRTEHFPHFREKRQYGQSSFSFFYDHE